MIQFSVNEKRSKSLEKFSQHRSKENHESKGMPKNFAVLCD